MDDQPTHLIQILQCALLVKAARAFWSTVAVATSYAQWRGGQKCRICNACLLVWNTDVVQHVLRLESSLCLSPRIKLEMEKAEV